MGYASAASMGQPGSAGSAPSSQELTQLAQTIVRRVGHYLSGKGCWSGMPNSYLTLDCVDEAPLNQLRPYRIAGGQQAGRKVCTLQTLPACDSGPEPQGELHPLAACLRPNSRHSAPVTPGR